MESFDLRFAPWIPIIDRDGVSADYGLYELFHKSSRISEVSSNSPIETISILRMLVGLVQHMVDDVFDENDWNKIYKKGSFDESLLNQYFMESDWAGNFDLFHPVHPFWQIPGLKNIENKTGEEKPVSLVTIDIPEASGNNKTLFSHRLDSKIKEYTPAEAARLLITAQFFSLGGLNKKYTNFHGYQQSYFNASLVSGMPVFILGDNLFESILLNLIPKKYRLTGYPRNFQSLGTPPWARSLPQDLTTLPCGEIQKDIIVSFLEFFLPWSRYIRLIPTRSLDNKVRVKLLHIAQGIALNPVDEMWTAKQKDTKKNKIRPLSCNPDRALWRDFGALLGTTSTNQKKTFIQPKNLEIYNHYRNKNQLLPRIRPIAVMTLSNDKAKALLWRKEITRFPIHCTEDIKNKRKIERSLDAAENISKMIKDSVRIFFIEALREHPDGKGQHRKSNDYANSNDALRSYWSSLELPFKYYLSLAEFDESFILTAIEEATNSLQIFFDQFVKDDIRYYLAQKKAERFFFGSLKRIREKYGLD